MKKTLTLLVCLFFASVMMAQHPHGPKDPGKPTSPNVAEMVSDLSAMQKKKLESITTESKQKVDKMQNELKSVRTKIRQLLSAEGDNSAALFPLFDRESALQAEISKEMYRTRLSVDQVLTPEQLKEFRAKLEADHKKHKHDKDHGGKHPDARKF